jgi:hypothetical protein
MKNYALSGLLLLGAVPTIVVTKVKTQKRPGKQILCPRVSVLKSVVLPASGSTTVSDALAHAFHLVDYVPGGVATTVIIAEVKSLP